MKPHVRFHFLTLFPEIILPTLQASLLGKAQLKGLVDFQVIQIRDFAKDKHRTVDGTPFGGGEGMVLRADVLFDAWESIRATIPCLEHSKEGSYFRPLTVLLSPQGQKFNQSMAHELKSYSDLILVCGHYEGIDERFIELCVDREVSIGDYVLTGGEVPALVLADAVTRLVPGVVGNERSLTEESLENGLLKYPQFTKPREFHGLHVPEILLGGDHKAIHQWRQEQMRTRTQRKRPDLLDK